MKRLWEIRDKISIASYLIYPILLLSCILTTSCKDKGQNVAAEFVYPVLLSEPTHSPVHGHLKLGSNISPYGSALDINSEYFIKDGKAWYPVMGEMHYSRLPQAEWEESILKMKASGIDIIATYIFWNYHEEKEKNYDWTGDRDLRYFAELCLKHDIYLFVRIGPWCHGEVRYGGLPDWIVNIKGGTRNDNPTYIQHVKRYFKEIGKQLKELYFKDGGPIIGVQIENEYRFNNSRGLKHMLNLKKIAIDSGLDVPYYTATGWPGSDLRQTELIPVWGAYPDAPWSKGSSKPALSDNYLYGPLRNDPLVGVDLTGQQDSVKIAGYQYPYATAEMGGGNQITYHRRPIITADDVVSLAYVKTGSGANLMGYYMYHGGSNKIGKYTTLQESRATKYPNDYPIISYDFYSPLGEWGQIRDSYREFKLLHMFMNSFGDRLAVTLPSFPEHYMHCQDTDDNEGLRMGVRSNGFGGFIFISNYQRGLEMKDLPGNHFRLYTTVGENLHFPKKPLTVKAGDKMILPFNFKIEEATLFYGNVQPVCLSSYNEKPLYVFAASEANESELVFSDTYIRSLSVDGKPYSLTDGKYEISCSQNAMHQIDLELINDKQVTVLLITQEQALNCWLLQQNDKEVLCFSSDELIPSNEKLIIRNTGNSTMSFDIFPADAPIMKINAQNAKIANHKDGYLMKYRVELPTVNLPVKYNKIENPASFVSATRTLAEDNRLDSVPATCPGPQYFVNFKPVAGSTYWTLTLPSLKGTNLSNAFLELDYRGDTGALYQNGKLVADDYYAGLPMSYSTRRLNNDRGETLLFQIIPWRSGLQIYWEDGVFDKINREEPAMLEKASLIPQYEITVNY